MAMDEVQRLNESACWALLRRTEVGRLAVCTAEGPDIFPVNYAVDRGSLVFRTAAGAKLAALEAEPALAFEVDGYDEPSEEAWSVVVHGRGQEIRTGDEALESAELPLLPWHAGPKNVFLRIVPHRLTGRRFRVVDAAAWRTVLAGRRPAAPE